MRSSSNRVVRKLIAKYKEKACLANEHQKVHHQRVLEFGLVRHKHARTIFLVKDHFLVHDLTKDRAATASKNHHAHDEHDKV